MASLNDNALYIGVSSDLQKRIYQHKEGLINGFTKKYHCHKLVYFESFNDPENAILREKQLKRWIRKKKNDLVNAMNPEWKDLSLDWHLDPSTSPGLNPGSAQDDNRRYSKQLLLPGITQAHQDFLKGTKLLMVGAGGLGATSLPYLAGAGIGHITIADNDAVDVSNLHRQTIFKDKDAGKNKAELAAAYVKELNPDITVKAITQRITGETAHLCDGYDIILDGSDNFETKKLLNEISIYTRTPLIAASVEQFNGSVTVFAGFANAPCYNCLFPELPLDCKTCVEGGILGTVAGLTGLYQAHITLSFLLGFNDVRAGTVLSLDFKTMRTQSLNLEKNPDCALCGKAQYGAGRSAPEAIIIPLLHPNEIKDHVIVDVRSDLEASMDPIEGAVHIRLDTIPERYEELPKDKMLAFVCSANIRSRKAAEYVHARGYKNVCVLDALAA